MKKFIVKSKARTGNQSKQEVFTVDDEDAYLFRSYVWNLCYSENGRPFLQRIVYKGVYEQLSRVLASPERDQVVRAKNGIPTDLRRGNLECISKADAALKASQAASEAQKKDSLMYIK